ATKVERFDWRSLFLVLFSVLLFDLLLRPLGLYLCLFILVMGSSIASHEFNWKVAVANAIFLIVFSYVAFVKGLGLIFPLYPWFIGYEGHPMELLENIMLGMSVAISPENLFYAFLGA